jgi:hypothetical protein
VTGHTADLLAFSLDGRFLFALNSFSASISSYQRSPDGSLVSRWTSGEGLPARARVSRNAEA